jgi:hypothetical protein
MAGSATSNLLSKSKVPAVVDVRTVAVLRHTVSSDTAWYIRSSKISRLVSVPIFFIICVMLKRAAMETPKIKLAGVRTPLKKASAADFVAGSITLFTATLATLEAAPFKTVGACENTLDTTARRTDGGVCTKAVIAYEALMLQSSSEK